MMRDVLCMIILIAGVALGQAERPAGVPALLEAANGKSVRVFLQEASDGNLTFIPVGASQASTIPAARAARLEFFPQEDAAEIKRLFLEENDRDALDGFLEPYAPFMEVPNALQGLYLLQVAANWQVRDVEAVGQAASRLVRCVGDEYVQQQGVRYAMLVAMALDDADALDALSGRLNSEAARAYLAAEEHRVKGEPKQAMEAVIEMIRVHANVVDWLGPCELLAAEIYMELAMTNSAIKTASLVESMSADSAVAWAAKTFLDEWKQDVEVE
jgi:hypothetical protein